MALFTVQGIQRYIFASNRLKENLGASELLRWSLEEGLREEIKHDPIYAGGGNAVYILPDEQTAAEVIRVWSLKLLKEAPGLQGVAAYHCIEGHNYVAAYKAALAKLDRLKDRTLGGAPLMALPIVKQCRSTGLAACLVDEDKDYCLSREAILKRKVARQALVRMSQALRNGLGDDYDFVPDFSDYEGSHVAVVYIDGDGMGDLLIRVIEDCPNEEELQIHLNNFSQSIKEATNQAYERVVQKLVRLVERKEFEEWRKKGLLPLRPIIHGGDDITFITLGSLGLTLAAEYLREFSKGRGANLHGSYQPITASAGVAIVPVKFPFAKGYALAEELCNNAKNKRREVNRGGSWLDFQLVQDAITSDLDSLRDALYAHREGKQLCARPYQVWGNSSQDRYDQFHNLWRAFRDWPINRAKRLLEALVEGEAATTALVEQFEHRNYRLPEVEGFSLHGAWDGSNTPYYDPLEMLDHHVDAGEGGSP